MPTCTVNADALGEIRRTMAEGRVARAGDGGEERFVRALTARHCGGLVYTPAAPRGMGDEAPANKMRVSALPQMARPWLER